MRSKVVPMDEVKAWPLRAYGSYGDPALAMDLRDFAVRHAGLPSEEKTLVTIEDYLRRVQLVAPRDIEDVYKRAHTVMRVQQKLRETTNETSLAPELEELVRALRSQGQAVE